MGRHKSFQLGLFCVCAAAILTCTSCGKSESKAATMYLVKTEGDVGVEDADGKSVALMDNLGLYSGYGLGTQSDSFAWIDLDDTKLAKMDQESDVGITKNGRDLEIFVNSGNLFFNVTEPLTDDESMEIRTSTMTCGIRGTCGWVTATGNRSCLNLLDGSVECTVVVDGVEETVTVNAKESLIVEEDDDGNVTSEVIPLVFDDVPEFVEEEVIDEPFVMEESWADDSQGDAEEDATTGTEDGGRTPADEEGESQEEQTSEAEETSEAVPGEEIPVEELGVWDVTGYYVLESDDNADEIGADFVGYTDNSDGKGGPIRIFTVVGGEYGTSLFESEWVLDESWSLRTGVTYTITDDNGNMISYVFDAEATGVTITVENSVSDEINSVAGHYVLQERYDNLS